MTYVTIVFELRRHQSLVFCHSKENWKRSGRFSRFRRCYMTRVTAASAPGCFPCSNNVALTAVYVSLLLSLGISIFNDRRKPATKPEVLSVRPGNIWETFYPFLHFTLFFYGESPSLRDVVMRLSVYRCRDTFSYNFAGSREDKEKPGAGNKIKITGGITIILITRSSDRYPTKRVFHIA